MIRRQVLVVADREDLGVRTAARAAAVTLGQGSAGIGVTVISGDDLASARWSHRVGADGRARTRLGLRGVVLEDDDIAAVLFRSQEWLVPPGLRIGSEDDVGYAWAELNALFVSWLATLGSRVLNAFEGGTPWGPAWSSARWRQLAADAGLPVGDAEVRRSVLVAGAHVTGAVSTLEAERCLQLADHVGCRHLEDSFTSRDEVCDAAPVPALVDAAHVAATATLLTEVAA
jgi:hypothetical protein